jgi:transposase-like protein
MTPEEFINRRTAVRDVLDRMVPKHWHVVCPKCKSLNIKEWYPEHAGKVRFECTWCSYTWH